ncbi:MAG TPA: hypothetical protein VF044_05760, partial [Actinomycetota bacterium]
MTSTDTSSIDATIVAAAVAVSGIAVGISLTDNNVGGSVSAYIAGSSTSVTAGGNGLPGGTASVALSASSTPTVVSSTTVLSGAFVGAVGAVSKSDELIDPNVSAYIDGGTVNAPGRPVTVNASFTALSDPQAISGGGALVGGSFAGVFSTSTIAGTTSAYAAGSTTISASSLQLIADDNSTTTPFALTASLSIVGFSLGAIDLDGTISRTTQAYIGAGNVQVGSGQISAHATSHATATLSATSIGATLVGFSIGLVTMTSTANGSTKAFVGDGAIVGAGSLDLQAAATNDVSTTSLNVALTLAGIAGSNTDIEAFDSWLVDAHIGPEVPSPSTTAADVTTSGNITVAASLTTTAVTNGDAANFGLLGAIGSIRAKSESTGTARSYLGTNAMIDSGSGAIMFDALANVSATADATGISVGGFSYSGAKPTAKADPTVKAFTAGGGTIDGDDATFRARLNPAGGGGTGATARVKLGAIGLLAGVAGGSATATSKPTVEASIGGGTVVSIDGTLIVRAQTVETAKADARGLGAGLVGFGASQATSVVDGTTNAFVAGTIGSAGAAGANNLTIEATSTAGSSANAQAVAGGLIGATHNVSDATASPKVNAYLGNSVFANVTTNISIDASAYPEADASTKGVQGGLAGVGGSESDSTVKPAVSAYIGSAATVAAGGTISVSATAAPQNVELPDYIIEAVSGANDTLNVTSHGLTTGDTIEYDPGSGSVIGGLTGPTNETVEDDGAPGGVSTLVIRRQYNVLQVTSGAADNFRLGNQFDGQPCLTSTSGGCIDEVFDRITFASGHNFQNGDGVRYDNAPGSSTMVGLNASTTYYVVVIDERTIRLVASQGQANNPASAAKLFHPTGAAPSVQPDNQTIRIFGHGFADGASVTYDAPDPFTVFSTMVDVSFGGFNSDGSTILNHDGAANNIYFLNADGFRIPHL